MTTPNTLPANGGVSDAERAVATLKRIAACTHGDPKRKSPKYAGRWVTVMMRPELWAEIEAASSGATCHDPNACAAGMLPCPTPTACRCAA